MESLKFYWIQELIGYKNLLDIRTLKFLSNRSKKWWLFMSHYCARSSFYSSNVMDWTKLVNW